MTDFGWAEPLWLETTPDDTGERLAREAVRSGVGASQAPGFPLGVLPCGTGNLLARNLGLP